MAKKTFHVEAMRYVAVRYIIEADSEEEARQKAFNYARDYGHHEHEAVVEIDCVDQVNKAEARHHLDCGSKDLRADEDVWYEKPAWDNAVAR